MVKTSSAHKEGRQITCPPTAVLLLALLLTGFGLRVYRLGDSSVWWDEGLAAWSARQSLVEIARWTSADVHPPLYFWMLHFWRLGSGDSEFALRFMSAAIGVLTVAATYLLGRVIGKPSTGLMAALLVCLSRFDIWWSQEMRMYGLAALLAALSLWAAIRLWDRGGWVDACLYVLFTTAGLYTLYLYALVPVVINAAWLWVLWHADHRGKTLLRWGATQAAVLVLCAPWLSYALPRIPTWSSASPVAPDVFLRIYWTVLTAGIPESVERYGWLTLPVLVIWGVGLICLIGITRRDWRIGRSVALLLIALLLPAGVVYLISLPREVFFYSPQLAPRYLLIFAPAFYVSLAWGLDVLGEGRRRPVGVILAAVVVAVAGYGLWHYYPGRILRDDYKSLSATLHAYQQPEDAVVLYTDKDWPVFAYHHPGPWVGVPHAQPVTPEYAEAHLSPVWSAHQGIWLVVTPYASIHDPGGEIAKWLAARAVRTLEHRFEDKILRFYARTQERANTAHQLAQGTAPSHILEAEPETGLRLAGYEQPVEVFYPGDTIHLFLYWERTKKDEQAHSIEVSLLDERNQTSKHVEASSPDGSDQQAAIRQQIDLSVPPDISPGSYTFALRSLPAGDRIQFGRARIRPRQLTTLPATDMSIDNPLRTDFDHGVRLLGYDLEPNSIEPGGTVELTLYWQAQRPIEQRYKVFTHVLGEVYNATRENFLWGQQDNEPANGTRPTSTWLSSEVIVDSYAIALDPDAPAGRYDIEVGLYDPATGVRLAVLDRQGQVLADHLVIANLTVESQ